MVWTGGRMGGGVAAGGWRPPNAGRWSTGLSQTRSGWVYGRQQMLPLLVCTTRLLLLLLLVLLMLLLIDTMCCTWLPAL